jgi:uncharacterized membrane protein
MMERRERVSKTIAIVFLIMFLFTLLQFLAPFFIAEGTITDLHGTVGIIDNQKTFDTLSFPWNIPYIFGDLLCHQKPERSFFLNGNQMPFCSRCTAIWVGLTIGLTLMLFYVIELNERFMAIVILSLVPIGIDGIGQLLGFWESTNLIRVITGLIVGVPVGCAIGVIIDELKSLLKSKTS